ncbi:MAG: right-handed parallel beta-helix repeat-containing protein [bacterium]
MTLVKALSIGVSLIFALSHVTFASIIHVPGDSATVQAGIDGAGSGDTVLVAPGSYVENILFGGVDIAVTSSAGAESTFLEPLTDAQPIVTFNSNESLDCELSGFTLRNSGASPAIEITGSSPTVRDNIFFNNREDAWSGVSVITIYPDAAPNVCYNLFYDNDGPAGISVAGAAAIFNNTIVDSRRYGIIVNNDTAVVINNIIVAAGQRAIIGSDVAWIDYNNVFEPSSGGPIGPNSISVDPRFVDPAVRDYRLSYLSTCINAGVPTPPYTDPDGTPADMGAFPWHFEPPAAVGIAVDSGTLTPTFTWTFSDTAATTQQGYELEVGTDLNWDVTEMWSSGQVSSGTGSALYGGTALQDRQLYYYRLRLDNGTTWGAWVTGRFAVQIAAYQTIAVPGQLPNIQDGIDAALPGDTVLVADGTYTGPGNRDLDFWGKNVILKSENGPDVAVIDCQGDSAVQRRAFRVHYGEDSTCVIDGLTLTNTYDDGDRYSREAAVLLIASAPTIRNCVITGNTGCGIYAEPAALSLIIEDCVVTHNSGYGGIWVDWGVVRIASSEIAFNNGAGAFIYSVAYDTTKVSDCLFRGNGGDGLRIIQMMMWEKIQVSNCTFVGNQNGLVTDWDWAKGSPAGASDDTTSSLHNNLAAYNRGAGIYLAAPFDYYVECNNSFGNAGSDWAGLDFGHGDPFGNLSLNPLFCDTTAGDFTLDSLSPCAPDNPLNQCGQVIGAYGVGCQIHADSDSDGIADAYDNCPVDPNPEQEDTDGDGVGDACCCVEPGDVDHSGSVDAGDLTYLVAYLFQGGLPPPCPEEGDVDGSGTMDVGDLTFLVAYLFQGGGPPLPCP